MWCKAKALLDLGRPREALESSQEATRINPDYERGWYLRGRALEELGEHEKAIKSYKKALKIDPEYRRLRRPWKRLRIHSMLFKTASNETC